ncbi:vasorin [Oryzias latipes]|uniref:Vasorin n=1 Tax=Oryzias latipes TaxID=8090 RepID=H2M3I5_ORYLA|nr:vasorin [Oryzias latipes]
MLLYSLLFFMPAVAFSWNCPDDCTCISGFTIFCIQQPSSTVPRVPITTRNLYIFNIGITTVSREDFRGLVELELLDLSQNELAEIPDGAFEMLSKLKNLDLSSNQITHISKDSFSGLVQLERLYLYANNIQSIHLDAFENLEMLLELKLQGNSLTSLPHMDFPRLLLLDLSNNNIPSLGPSDLQTPHLEALKLGSLGLTTLDEELIASLRNLHELDLSLNRLHEVPKALKLDSLKGLMKLNLSANPQLELKHTDLLKLSGLQELDLSGLNLQGFSEGFFETFPKLVHLTAAENPFNCLCPLAWVPVWLKGKGVTLGRPDETRCHFPLVNAGKMLSALDHKDFGCPPTTTESFESPIANTVVSQMPTSSPEITHTDAIPPPPPPSKETVSSKTDIYLPPLEFPVSPSSASDKYKQFFCPPNICLNGGTCNFDPQGQLSCSCPSGASGLYCENLNDVNEPQPSPTEVSEVVPVVPDKVDVIISRQVTSTSILLDLHHFIETQPHIRGIKLTYRNLSGPDRRPIVLSLPTSYPEYTLRGLRPNCTYSVCASPLGERPNSWGNGSLELGSCTEARTEDILMSSPEPLLKEKASWTSTLISSVAALVLGLAVVVGTIVSLRKRHQARAGLEQECGTPEPDPMDLEGIKVCLENGVNGKLPLKQPETDFCQPPQCPQLQNGNLDHEAPLIHGHCQSNNNLTSLKPSYF